MFGPQIRLELKELQRWRKHGAFGLTSQKSVLLGTLGTCALSCGHHWEREVGRGRSREHLTVEEKLLGHRAQSAQWNRRDQANIYKDKAAEVQEETLGPLGVPEKASKLFDRVMDLFAFLLRPRGIP